MLLVLIACSGSPAGDAPGAGNCGDTGARDSGDTGGSGIDARVDSVADAGASVYGAATAAVGIAMAFAGDDDADGYDDAVLGASFLGRTCVWRGPLAPGAHAFADLEDCWAPEGNRDYAGQAVDGGSDVTGDSVPDLLVGAITNGDAGAQAGKVYVIAGPYTGGSLADAPVQLLGEAPGDYAGMSVVLLGDVDGDGAGDLLVGAPANDAGGSGAGRAYLVRGPVASGTRSLGHAWATITGDGPVAPGRQAPLPLWHGAPAAGDGVGSVACSAGDMNGDGLIDLVLGANGNEIGGNDAGAAAIFFGPVGEGHHGLVDADQLWIGENADHLVGDAVAAAGDLDGDGLADVLVSGDTNGPGTVWVVRGPGITGTNPIGNTMIRFEGESVGDLAGAATAGAGDTDGDGWPDLLIGAYARDTTGAEDVGAAYLLRGPFAAGVTPLGSAHRAWYGRTASDQAGRAVAGGGDLDGDGLSDLLVGAPYSEVGGAFGGEAYAFFGR